MLHDPPTAGEVLDRVLTDAEGRLSADGRVVYADTLVWYAFPETWSSTALGFGGMGGAMITTAQTHIVLRGNRGLLYWGGRFAREITRERALNILAAHRSKA